ncbi:uncharacterized protein LOC126376815 [Pectinophora gossypiella]|uniref:uncharacterized protein LOC126376815 n=1 Tax=Pectinophora gossypiella TaxID=13191 RepID=UPI00214EC75E|nr:uncharacterized protein LOC126376815 [Pectinophora gossypiella]
MKAKPKTEEAFENFENYDWMKGTILQNIPPSSVIVLNQPYCESAESILHDEKPTTAATRTMLQDWLKRHNIPFKETDAKCDLFKIINSQEASLQYSLSRLIIEKNHEVLHLPEHHVDLNPTAIVWEQVKGNAEKTSPKVLFKEYAKKKWEKCFEDVKRNEEEYFNYNNDLKVDNTVSIVYVKKEIKSESEDSMDFEEHNLL